MLDTSKVPALERVVVDSSVIAPAAPADGVAHFTPSVCAESAVRTWLFDPTGSLAAVSAALATARSPLVSQSGSAATPGAVAGVAHFTPSVCAESAVRTWPLL